MAGTDNQFDAALIPEDIRHRAVQSARDVLNGFQRDILPTQFEPVQRGMAQSHFSGKLHVGEVSALLAQKHRELSCQALGHTAIVWPSLSHKC
jgi:hypothetical protein